MSVQAAMQTATVPPLFRPCIVIPYYNHEGAIGDLIERLRPNRLSCWIVDDGSSIEAARVVDALAAAEDGWLRVLRLPHNQGKGSAVHAGCEAAVAAGYTHAVQIDADGQHDAADVPRLLAAAAADPAAVVTGVPRYDETIPRIRYYGRYLTHALVWLHTRSFDLVDTMCGFRVYPLLPALQLWRRELVGHRMDFDTEMLVRLYWSGLHVINVPTRVTYPQDGVSHFRYLRDNARMVWLHLRLFAGMLRRLPRRRARP